MRTAKITLFILSLIALSVFQIVSWMSADPTDSSGNGNPALLISAALVPIFIVMLFLWVRVFRVNFVSIRATLIGLLATIIHLVGAYIYQKIALANHRVVVKSLLIEKYGTTDIDMEYLKRITSFLDIHANNQYFTVNTFFMFLTFSIFIASAYHLWDLLEEKQNLK